MKYYMMQVRRTPCTGMVGKGVWDPSGWLFHLAHEDYINYLIEEDCKAYEAEAKQWCVDNLYK